MIERDIVTYLLTQASVTGLCNKIYAIQAPKEAVMPYIVIEVTGGTRKKLGVQTEESVLLRITTDCGPAQLVSGRAIIEAVLDVLENRRGLVNIATDAVIENCSAVRGWAGMAGTYRYMFDATVKHMETRNNP